MRCAFEPRPPRRWRSAAALLALCACAESEPRRPSSPTDAAVTADAGVADDGGTLALGCLQRPSGRIGAATLYLPAPEQVLIAAGMSLTGATLSLPRDVRLYDPRSGTEATVSELPVGSGRIAQASALLSDGTVLLAGGDGLVGGQLETLRSCVRLDARDPQAVLVRAAAPMATARAGHTATPLPDGRVLILGGRTRETQATRPEDHRYLADAEIYLPELDRFEPALASDGRPLLLSRPRYGHSATLLGERAVLVAGGLDASGGADTLELLELDGQRFKRTEPPPRSVAGPGFHAVAAMGDAVLLAGGYPSLDAAEPPGGAPHDPSAQVEIWSLGSDGALSLRCRGQLATPRGYAQASALPGRVLISGGRDPSGASIPFLEDINPLTCAAVSPPRPLCASRAEHSAIRLGAAPLLLLYGGRETSAGEALGREASALEVLSAQ